MHATNVSLFGQVQFTEAGGIMEVLVDEVMKLRYPLNVSWHHPSPGRNAPPPPQAPILGFCAWQGPDGRAAPS